MAKRLIETFGSFSRAMDASVDELQQVKGMGKASSLNLSFFRQVMAYYFEEHITEDKEQITKMSTLIEMLRANIGHKPNEVLFAIFFNAKNEVIHTQELFEGTLSRTVAFPRRIAEIALKVKASSIILAHNHPGGVAEPSDDDIVVTTEIQKSLALLEIGLQDHIILAENEYYSFKRYDLI